MDFFSIINYCALPTLNSNKIGSSQTSLKCGEILCTFCNIDKYVEDYEVTSGALIRQRLLDDPTRNKSEVVAGNLIAKYRMLRRFRKYIQRELLKPLASDYNNCSSCGRNLCRVHNQFARSLQARLPAHHVHLIT